jgi:hypothetical protein
MDPTQPIVDRLVCLSQNMRLMSDAVSWLLGMAYEENKKGNPIAQVALGG